MAKSALPMVEKVLYSGNLTQGQQCAKYEEALQDYMGHPYAAAVNSGTSALHLALYYLKEKYGWSNPEAISTPLTCAATNMPIHLNGYTIKWADIDDSYNISLDSIWENLNENTKVIVIVHWGGIPIDYEKLNDLVLAWPRPLFVIEDCAHAWGSKYNGMFLSAQHQEFWKCYSTQAIKTLTTGDGGVICSPNKEANSAIRKLRWFGLDRDNNQTFRSAQDIEMAGWKFHMNDIAATIGLANLRHVDDLVNKQRDIAAYYNENLKFPTPIFRGSPSWWLYTLTVDDNQRFMEYMRNKGIQTSTVHTRNDRLTCFRQYQSSNLPNMDRLQDRMVCIPCGFWLTDTDVEYIVNVINEY